MVISHNLLAMNAQRQFNTVGIDRKKSAEKLSSGYKINRAADDAAGLTISEKMRSLIRGLNQGSDNIQDGISLVQVADGALAEVHKMLQRATELSVKAANGTMTAEDRASVQSEITELVSEIQRVADSTTFNEMNLFDDPDYYGQYEGSITKLVSSDSADVGRLAEAYESGGKYYPAAYINFSGINSDNIDKLNGGNFAFWCSDNCDEIFDITFKTDGDGNQSSAKNLNGRQRHEYVVDISECTSGNEVVDKIYKYVSSNLPTNDSSSSATSLKDGVKVSHSNNLINGGDKLIIACNFRSTTMEKFAKSMYQGMTGKSGKITCSEIYSEKIPDARPFDIQCSNIVEDVEQISIPRMNTKILGIQNLDLSTVDSAREGIDTISDAASIVSEIRSRLAD